MTRDELIAAINGEMARRRQAAEDRMAESPAKDEREGSGKQEFGGAMPPQSSATRPPGIDPMEQRRAPTPSDYGQAPSHPEIPPGETEKAYPMILAGALGGAPGYLGMAGGATGMALGGAMRRHAAGGQAFPPIATAVDAAMGAAPGLAIKGLGAAAGGVARSAGPRVSALAAQVEAFLKGKTLEEAARERFPMDQVRASGMPPANIPRPPPGARPPAPPQGPTDVTPGDIPQLGPRVLTPPEPAGPGPGPGGLLGPRVFEPEPPMQGYVNRGPRTRFGGKFAKAPDPGPKAPGNIDEVGDTSLYDGPPQQPQAMVPAGPQGMQNTPMPLPGPNRVPLPGPGATRQPAGQSTVDTTAETAINGSSRPGASPIDPTADSLPEDFFGYGPLDQIIAGGPKGANSAALNAARTEGQASSWAQSQSQAGKFPPDVAGQLNSSAQQLGEMAPSLRSASDPHIYAHVGPAGVRIPVPGMQPGNGFISGKASSARYISAAAEAAKRGRMQLIPELQSWINENPGLVQNLTPFVTGLLGSEAP